MNKSKGNMGKIKGGDQQELLKGEKQIPSEH